MLANRSGAAGAVNGEREAAILNMVSPQSDLPADRDDAEPLLQEFRSLWQEADALWTVHQNDPEFLGYVSADYLAVFRMLSALRDRAQTFLEWGSGLGVVTIMASRLGYDAYGIETEELLVDYSRDFAARYAPKANFALGNFIPDEFEWQPSEGDEVQRTAIDTPAAYATLDMELRDFDLVYAYPWPDEQTLFSNIMRQCGGRGAYLLSYDVREGLSLKRPRRPRD